MTLVDANVLLDLATEDPHWADWSLAALSTASLSGPLLINDVVYAEFSARYETIEVVEDFLSRARIELSPLPREALFLAGKAFGRYRKTGGTRTGVLSDFFIGAHASVTGAPLLTRDIRRYRTYFPTVKLISPKPQ